VDEPERKPPLREPPAERRAPLREPPEIEEKSVSAAGGETVAGVQLTHASRVLYPEEGITKIDLARYYEAVSKFMLPHVAGRPLMLLRCPEGYRKQCFFQKHPSVAAHPALGHVEIREAKGSTETYLTLEDLKGLVALVQMGVLEIHVWGALADRIEQPDRVVFDLDPDPSVPWKQVVACALELRDRLAGLGLESFAKLSGGKGVHVVVPIRRGPGWDQVKRFSSAIASDMVAQDPKGLTLHLAKARRGGRIFIDTLRNRRGATWVAAYSPRAREGAPVSLPIEWSELKPSVKPNAFTLRAVASRLANARSDPWTRLASLRQTLSASLLKEVERSSQPL
jgi:bifunctional non-homologous end joining protein LigD